jgi:uncharacterized membrane protein (TIGR02234 family)
VPETSEASDAPHAPEPSASRSGGRRSVALALLLGVAGAAVVLLAGGKTWAHGKAAFLAVSASGQDVTQVPGALALVGLAALLAVFAVRGVGRTIISALLALSGAGAVAAALLALGDTTALDAKASTATSVAHASVSASTDTVWPWVSAVGGAMILAAGTIALVRGRAWPGMSNRYDRDGTEPRPRKQRKPVVDPDRPEDLWKALDRGEDPTDAV